MGTVRRLLDHPSCTSLNARSRGGWTPLMLAVGCGMVDCVRELVAEKGVDLETKDNIGKSLEDMARESRHMEAWEVVRKVLEKRGEEARAEISDDKIEEIVQLLEATNTPIKPAKKKRARKSKMCMKKVDKKKTYKKKTYKKKTDT